MRFLRRRVGPVGIEIGTESVRLLQLERRGDAGRVRAHAVVPRSEEDRSDDESPVPEALARRVREAWREAGFVGRRAVVAMPSEETIVRHVKLEADEDMALQQALLGELEGAFPGDVPRVQSLVVGEVVERGRRRLEIILLAAGSSRIEALVRSLDAVGIEPLAIDAEICSLVRAYLRRRRRESDRDRHTAIVHVSSTTTLMAIAAGDRALFMKRIPIGAAGFFEHLERRLDLTADDVAYAAEHPEEAEEVVRRIREELRYPLDPLLLEVSACLRYHAASRRSPSGVDIVLSGRGATIPGLGEQLGEALSSPIQRPDPFSPAYSGVEAAGRVAREFALWPVPLGLALREPDRAAGTGRRRRAPTEVA